jgi:crotonobetainyl-CoA:carnitine CoA-transferase CaiB-like acyl-CoA transferase
MSDETLTDVVRNIDTRLARVEQFLPTLATREELQTSIAPLATREEMHAAIAAAVAPLATREEMHAAIAEAVAPLARRDEMHAAIQSEGERARNHATMLFEDLRDDNRIILEHLLALSARVDVLASR